MRRVLETEIVGNFADRLFGAPEQGFGFVDHPQMNMFLGRFARETVEQVGKVIRREVQLRSEVFDARQAPVDQCVFRKIIVQQPFEMLHQVVADFRAGVKLAVVKPITVIKQQLDIARDQPERVLVDILGILPLDLGHAIADEQLFILGNMQCLIDIVIEKRVLMHLLSQFGCIEQVGVDEQRPPILHTAFLDAARYDLPGRREHERALAEIVVPLSVLQNAVNALAGDRVKAEPKCRKLSRALRVELRVVDQADQRVPGAGRAYVLVQAGNGLDIKVLAGHNIGMINAKYGWQSDF